MFSIPSCQKLTIQLRDRESNFDATCLANERRKEIYQALTAEMGTIFQFLLTLLERHYQAYLNAPASAAEARTRHCKVCEVVLSTFNSFVEWVPIVHIMANDRYLVRCLCHLLSDTVDFRGHVREMTEEFGSGLGRHDLRIKVETHKLM